MSERTDLMAGILAEHGIGLVNHATPMTLPPNRIEAAARAIRWATDIVDEDHARKIAVFVLSEALPEIANGTAWVAPMEATEGMIKAGDYLCEHDGEPVAQIYRFMRDAFLQEPKEP